MAGKTWFLRRRITLGFTLTVFLLSSILALVLGVGLMRSVQDEIEGLAREELEETRANFLGRVETPQEFASVAQEMTDLHPDNPLAWVVWRIEDGQPWAVFGKPELRALMPDLRSSVEGIHSMGTSYRWAVSRLSEQLSVGILLDVSHQVDRFRGFALSAALFVLLATALSALAGWLLARRVSLLLERTAQSARSPADPRGFEQVPDAPEEIREVVSAMQGTLARIELEGERTRLITSGMAHELRSPLQNLMGELQVALLRERDSSEYRRVLESQLEELSELSRAVDNLVTLCADESAGKSSGRECFDLAKEARLRLTREFSFAQRRGVELELKAPDSLLIDGDREALVLALRNVITNAIEWSPAQGRVCIEFRAGAEEVEVLVDDSGPGVPPEHSARIFEPFQRGPALQGRRVGFGLGLALTRTAIVAHGGTIEVLRAPLGGARFRILLPLEGEPGDPESGADVSAA